MSGNKSKQDSTSVLDSIKDNLNSTGIFLESYVYDFFVKQGHYGVQREVSYGINVGLGDPLDGECDIVASAKLDEDTVVCFVVECKRAQAEQKYWVFEKGHLGPSPHPLLTYVLPANNATFRDDIHLSDLGYMKPDDYESAINIYEFDIKLGRRASNLDKRERAFIALRQVNEAFSGLAVGPHKALEIAHNTTSKEGLKILYLPLVITTATLLVADYKAEDIDYQSGSILDNKKINLNEKGWVHFEFPLSGALRTHYGEYTKRPTFVVNVNSMPDFITFVENAAKTYM